MNHKAKRALMLMMVANTISLFTFVPELFSSETSWVSESMFTPTVDIGNNDMVVDSNGDVHLVVETRGRYHKVAYYTNHGASAGGSGWTSEYLIPTPPFDPWIDYRSGCIARHGNEVFIAYYLRSGFPAIASQNRDLRLWTKNLETGAITQTTIDTVGDVGKNCDIVVDQGGGVHIAYYDETNEQIKYAYRGRPGGDWQIANAALVGWSTVTHFDLLVDASKNVHIVYQASWTVVDGSEDPSGIAIYDLKHVFKASGAAAFGPPVAVDRDGNTGNYLSAVMDASNIIHVVYFANTVHELKHATKRPSIPWQRHEPLATTNMTEAAAVVDASLLHSFFLDYDAETEETLLRHVSLPLSGDDSSTEILARFSVGLTYVFLLAAVDPRGGLHVVYQDPASNENKYMHTASIVEEEETVTPPDGSGTTTQSDGTEAAQTPTPEVRPPVVQGPVDINNADPGKVAGENCALVGIAAFNPALFLFLSAALLPIAALRRR